MFVEVAVNLGVDSTFDYRIPPELDGRLKPGQLVKVSFGRQVAQGIVIGLRETPQFSGAIKPVQGLIDRVPVITPIQIALSQWMSRRYLTNLSQCIELFIPPGLSKKGDMLVTSVVPPGLIEAYTENQSRLLRLLQKRGPLRQRQIAHALPKRNWQNAVSQLVDRGVLLRESVLDPPSVSPKKVKFARATITPEHIEHTIEQHIKLDTKTGQRQATMLRLLAESGRTISLSEIYQRVDGGVIKDLRILADKDLIQLTVAEIFRNPLADYAIDEEDAPILTPFQEMAWRDIQQMMSGQIKRQPILLHGVTGSGKTELYIRAVEQALAHEQSAIVLVPEIALTPQTIKRFGSRFPSRIALIHSGLSTGERYDTWRRIRSGQFDIVIGPRSALFAPVQNLGVIIIDECHDDNYKQSPPMLKPFYNAVDTALKLAALSDATAILGSATPNVTTYYQAQSDTIHPLTLPGRIATDDNRLGPATALELPPVHIVDMRQELRVGNTSIFSRVLLDALSDTMTAGHQAILFMNRRGRATYVFCRNCGFVFRCPNCDIPLTLHMYHTHSGDQRGMMVCHQCNHRDLDMPQSCPDCTSNKIKYFGSGTERIQQAVSAYFPHANIIRWDTDTVAQGNHHTFLESFLRGDADILIGTQMIAKGLDLPRVTLVGVVDADTGLNFPDFRSNERTFQLLMQVAGRAGRSVRGGEVIFQTYNPDHYALQAAAEHNYPRFYNAELRYRAELRNPPYSRLARIIIQHADRTTVQAQAKELEDHLSEQINKLGLEQAELIGPAPAFYPKIDNQFRWHLIIRAEDPSVLLHDLPDIPNLTIDIDPVSLL